MGNKLCTNQFANIFSYHKKKKQNVYILPIYLSYILRSREENRILHLVRLKEMCEKPNMSILLINAEQVWNARKKDSLTDKDCFCFYAHFTCVRRFLIQPNTNLPFNFPLSSSFVMYACNCIEGAYVILSIFFIGQTFSITFEVQSVWSNERVIFINLHTIIQFRLDFQSIDFCCNIFFSFSRNHHLHFIAVLFRFSCNVNFDCFLFGDLLFRNIDWHAHFCCFLQLHRFWTIKVNAKAHMYWKSNAIPIDRYHMLQMFDFSFKQNVHLIFCTYSVREKCFCYCIKIQHKAHNYRQLTYSKLIIDSLQNIHCTLY